MSLQDFISKEQNVIANIELQESIKDELDTMIYAVNKAEFKFYFDVSGISKDQKAYLKRLKKNKSNKFKFINRNIPIGGIRACLKCGDIKKAKTLLDRFNSNINDRIEYIKKNYNPQITAIKDEIEQYKIDDAENEMLKTKQEALLKARRKEKEERIDQEKTKQEEDMINTLKTKQSQEDADRLYNKQQELNTKNEQKAENKAAKNEEINNKRKETKANNIKERKISELVGEYGGLIARHKELIGIDDDKSKIEREKVKFDIDHILKMAKTHEIDEGGLAWRFRQSNK
jgi:hypothetical protein